MKETTSEKFNSINKNATVGTRMKFIAINPPKPIKGRGKITATIKSSKTKRRKCSGCSRKRVK